MNMVCIGLIKERKDPPDSRVALTPFQAKYIKDKYDNVDVIVESSDIRCFKDDEYRAQGIEVTDDISHCDILFGVKEVPVDHLIPEKTYLFFSHTKKMQPYNQKLMHALIEKKIRMIDYECLTHSDEQRILGFGLFAGIVGAHNGLLTYGKKFGMYDLPAAHTVDDYQTLINTYRRQRLPNIKIAVTGSGRVAAGIIEVMTNLDIESVEPEDYLANEYEYPVYTQLKGQLLYAHKERGDYIREDFHEHPQDYKCLFADYTSQTDILMNGIYWDEDIERLFEKEDIKTKDWRISVIADITCDINGSVPINIGASTIAQPVYGINRSDMSKVGPYQNSKEVIDVMAVDNLPNELPRDASHYFGAHLEKFILRALLSESNDIIERATICKNGKLTPDYEYMSKYAYK